MGLHMVIHRNCRDKHNQSQLCWFVSVYAVSLRPSLANEVTFELTTFVKRILVIHRNYRDEAGQSQLSKFYWVLSVFCWCFLVAVSCQWSVFQADKGPLVDTGSHVVIHRRYQDEPSFVNSCQFMIFHRDHPLPTMGVLNWLPSLTRRDVFTEKLPRWNI